MAKMDWLVKKLNEDKNYKYRIAETIHVYGFGIVKEKDWSNLVKYRG